jgi:hypothetical protein
MSTRTLVLALITLAAASCDQPSVDPSKPEAYALQIPLEPAPGERLQRVTLPAQALATLRRDDFGDIRLFDSRGKVVPIAFLNDEARASQRTLKVPVYPVVGPASALGSSALSIRIEDGSAAHVVTVDSGPPPVNGATPPAAVLLDTRGLRESANAIVLDADIPADKPVTVTLVTSANLKDWAPLAQKVLFRPGKGSALLGGATVALPGVDLRDLYVGISWGPAAGVAVKGASVVTSSVAPPARVAVATSAVSLVDAHELRFDLPDMARLAAIRLTSLGSDGVIPVKLFGRSPAADTWVLLSATTLRPGDGANVLEFAGPPLASYRLQADSRTAGFSAPPRLELLFEPVQLLAALSGTPPYRLAVGQEAAPPAYLTLAEIAPHGTPPKLASLPQARLAPPTGPAPVIALQASRPGGGLEPRKLVLWAALLMGTSVLAFAAIRLLRATATTAPIESE